MGLIAPSIQNTPQERAEPTPDRSGGQVGALSNFLGGKMRLLTLGLLAACSNPAPPTAPVPAPVVQSDICKVEMPEVKLTAAKGNWNFSGAKPRAVLISGDFPTLTRFIEAHLNREEDFARLPEADKEDYMEAIISLARKLNPSLNLNDLASYKGKAILLPTELSITPGFDEVLKRGSKGTRRLEELALYDGYEITDPEEQERIYQESLANTIPIPPSPHYARKLDNGESPNRLYQVTIERLSSMTDEFSTLEFGGIKAWGEIYTDALRNLALQKKTYEDKGKKTVYQSTGHTTGQAFDLTKGRVRHPTLGEISYSDFTDPAHPVPSQWAPIIESMWPEMERLALKHGFVVYDEGDHLHLYAPNNRHLEGLFDGAWTVEPLAQGQPYNKIKVIETRELLALNRTIDAKFTAMGAEGVDAKPEKAEAQYLRLEAIRKGILDISEDPPSPKSYHMMLRTFPDWDASMAPYAGSTLEDLHAQVLDGEKKIEALRVVQRELKKEVKKGVKSKESALATQDAMIAALVSKLDPINQARDAKMKQEIEQLIQWMTPQQLAEREILRGSVLHLVRKSPTFDIQKAWAWKIAESTMKSRQHLGPHVQRNLEGRNQKVTFQEWHTHQEAAAAFVRENLQELGYPAELEPYMTPALVLATMHGEFMSELTGETYLEVIPETFQAYNVAAAPALGDKEFSGGVVQIIYDSFNSLVDRKGDKLSRMSRVACYPLIVPEQKSVQVGTDGATIKEFVDPDQVVKAVLAHGPSQGVYAQLAALDHLTPAFRTAMENPQFKAAWDAASGKNEAKRIIFLGSLSSMAINAGPGGAQNVIEKLLSLVNSSDLAAYTVKIPDACVLEYGVDKEGKPRPKSVTTARNADRGRQTMTELLEE